MTKKKRERRDRLKSEYQAGRLPARGHWMEDEAPLLAPITWMTRDEIAEYYGAKPEVES